MNVVYITFGVSYVIVAFITHIIVSIGLKIIENILLPVPDGFISFLFSMVWPIFWISFILLSFFELVVKLIKKLYDTIYNFLDRVIK